METTYEWDIEEDDGDLISPDILDHHHEDRLSDFGVVWKNLSNPNFSLVLVRDTHDRHGNLKLRLWAYCTREDGKLVLPKTFDNCGEATEYVVPQRFHRELSKFQGT